jgi:hypothetical protein
VNDPDGLLVRIGLDGLALFNRPNPDIAKGVARSQDAEYPQPAIGHDPGYRVPSAIEHGDMSNVYNGIRSVKVANFDVILLHNKLSTRMAHRPRKDNSRYVGTLDNFGDTTLQSLPSHIPKRVCSDHEHAGISSVRFSRCQYGTIHTIDSLQVPFA